MAISNYDSLVAAAADWLNRSDSTTRISDAIPLAEAKMNRLLRTHEQTTRNATFTINSEYVTAPSDFAEAKVFYLNTNPKRVLEYLADDSQTQIFGDGSGSPRYFSVVGPELRFGPPPDGTYSGTLVYYKKISGVTSANSVTSMLTAYPDLYLYGICMEVSIALNDDPSTDKYSKLFYGAMEELTLNTQRRTWGGNAMAVRRA